LPSAMDNGQGIVRLTGLAKSFERHRVLRGITVEFPEGCTTVVMGPSGCGKTVMLKHIIGLLQPDRGEVWFGDQRIDTMSEIELSPIRKRIGYLFQLAALFDSMTVRDNVAFPLIEHKRLPAAEIEERVLTVLRMVGMAASIDKMPAELSGGQRKRVALARAIVLDPELMLYDEPTTGLDPIRSDVINRLILKLQRELHMTSIVVTHDLNSAFTVADYMVMLYDGVVVMRGTPDEFRACTDPTVKRFLDGEATAEELAGITSNSPPAGHDTQETA